MILLGFEVNLPIFVVSVAHGWRKGGDGARAPREVIMTGLKGVICLVVVIQDNGHRRTLSPQSQRKSQVTHTSWSLVR